MAANGREALLRARPPATDHMTYLTIIEYNLSVEVLPTLHDILQDGDLTAAIGWDLVLPLIPLLPDSHECLLDLARLGNPREVTMMVAQALRLLKFDADEDKEDMDVAVAGDEAAAIEHKGTEPSSDAKPPLPVIQFQALVSMMAVLHPRIKFKYPSRFLAGSLSAVLAAYKHSGPHAGQATESVIGFVKALGGTKRPPLPPRTSSSVTVIAASNGQSAPDPEGTDDAISSEEAALQRKLLQSFLSHVLGEYLASLTSDHDVPGMAWSVRLQEKLHADKIPDVPGRTPFVDGLANEPEMLARSFAVGQIVALADDLGLEPSSLVKTVLAFDPQSEVLDQGDDPPDAADDVPFSEWGALFLVAASMAKKTLYANESLTSPISIFPDHASILHTYFGGSPKGRLEPSIDTALFIGMAALETGSIGETPNDDEFTTYLMQLCGFAVNTPSPALRYGAHCLSTAVLHAHPSDKVRLYVIVDTLEHCPYENLKASAIGWLKDEIISANLATNASRAASPESASASAEEHSTSLFASPVALSRAAEFLFPDLAVDLPPEAPLRDVWAYVKENVSLVLATLSFCYFLLRASALHGVVDVPSLFKGSRVVDAYVGPLKAAVARLKAALVDGELEAGVGEEPGGMAELGIVEESVERIEDEVGKLGW